MESRTDNHLLSSPFLSLPLRTPFVPTSPLCPTALSVLPEISLLLHLHCKGNPFSPLSFSKLLAPDPYFQLPFAGTENRTVGPGRSPSPFFHFWGSSHPFHLSPLPPSSLYARSWEGNAMKETCCTVFPTTKTKPTTPQDKSVKGQGSLFSPPQSLNIPRCVAQRFFPPRRWDYCSKESSLTLGQDFFLEEAVQRLARWAAVSGLSLGISKHFSASSLSWACQNWLGCWEEKSSESFDLLIGHG